MGAGTGAAAGPAFGAPGRAAGRVGPGAGRGSHPFGSGLRGAAPRSQAASAPGWRVSIGLDHPAEDLRVLQRPVQAAPLLQDPEGDGEHVEPVGGRANLRLGERDRVKEAQLRDRDPRVAEVVEQHVPVEPGVMGEAGGVPDELQQVRRDLREAGLVRQEPVREPVHPLRLPGDGAFRVEVGLEGPAGQATVDQLHRADLDAAVPLGRGGPGRLRVDRDEAHRSLLTGQSDPNVRKEEREVGRGVIMSTRDADRVRGLLADIEARHDVRVLMAVESGSRAWGFASPDSDFDVRFVYQEPLDRMVRLFPDRDVIEEMTPYHPDGTGVPIDLVGWSLPKTLRLGAASNPQLCEWARGTVTYLADPDFMRDLRLLTAQASPRVLAHHYRGLAKKTVLDYLSGPDEPVGKKYLYAVRSLLAASWMLDHPTPGSAPPGPVRSVACGNPRPRTGRHGDRHAARLEDQALGGGRAPALPGPRRLGRRGA